jgi:hypothetical protein
VGSGQLFLLLMLDGIGIEMMHDARTDVKQSYLRERIFLDTSAIRDICDRCDMEHDIIITRVRKTIHTKHCTASILHPDVNGT